MNTKTLIVTLLSTLCLYFHSSWSATDDAVVLYPAISSGDTTTLEGRVTERKNSSAPTNADRKRDNFRRNMELMINNERKHYPVTVRLGTREWQVTTDQEGYFRVDVESLQEFSPGWHTVTGQTAKGEGTTGLLIVPQTNTHGLISDVDDTVQITEVNSKSRMLANTFLRNATQRQPVPGIVPFYRELVKTNAQPDLAPIIYLSASPKQLHTAIESFLVHNQFPRGVLTTKRVTDDSTSDPISDQVAYKTVKIETILKHLPSTRFTLIGDDGEHDPEIYADIQQRFPARVAAIWIRHVNPDPKRARIAGQGVLNDALKQYVNAVTGESSVGSGE
jgi:phosphatidate phosphatase APP1